MTYPVRQHHLNPKVLLLTVALVSVRYVKDPVANRHISRLCNIANMHILLRLSRVFLQPTQALRSRIIFRDDVLN